jgi:hypothetical protein
MARSQLLVERDRAFAVPRDPIAEFLGDPLPGRSALDCLRLEVAPASAAEDTRALLAGRRKIGGYRAERRLQLRAEGVNDRNDRNRDAGGDQPVFDCGGARFIVE